MPVRYTKEQRQMVREGKAKGLVTVHYEDAASTCEIYAPVGDEELAIVKKCQKDLIALRAEKLRLSGK